MNHIALLSRADSQGNEDYNNGIAPWFSTYNQYVGGNNGPATIWQFDPFPDKQFCANSPWESHVVIAHHGIEPFARAAGFDLVVEYLQHRIATAPKQGGFCTGCKGAKHCSVSKSI